MSRPGRPRKEGPLVFSSRDANKEDTADRGIYYSADGQRRQAELLDVPHKKRRLAPTRLDDRLASWIPVQENDDSHTFSDEFVHDAAELGQKRKFYLSSDDPMADWRPKRNTYADEILRHEGLVDLGLNCALCSAEYNPVPAAATDEELAQAVRLFKCSMCGEFMQCGKCCVHHHQRSPLHTLEEWNGNFWVKATLRELGLVYQLGHGGGVCLGPDPKIRQMVVLSHPYVHTVKFRYCRCRLSDFADPVQQLLRNRWYPATQTDPSTCATFVTLDIFRLQNVVGNMNVYDFVTSMERQTNAIGSCGVERVPSRYKEFMRMSRQWSYIGRMKRAGVAHQIGSLQMAKPGKSTVICWTCPYDGRNLPPNWRDVEAKFRFLYMLILALDANFKLKNRIRANARNDPALGAGHEYFVEPNTYREHLRNYVPEKDISSCIAFAALLQKDTRATAGLRCTGVGGCVCVRHECVRPNGIGDLQKGERYVNMDWILLCALLGFCLMWLTLSYDIACQWKKRLSERMEKMLPHMRLPLATMQLQCTLPVWHAGSHDDDCNNANSLSVKPGVGKSDGEGVKRTWAVLNPVSYHTKDMGVGNREDHLNDKIDNHNFLKNLGQGLTLAAKLIVALGEREKQVAAFTAVSETVEKELQTKWSNEIKAWLADETQPNPYVFDKSDTPSEAQVRLELKREEEAEAQAGGTLIHGTSATAFLTAGMQIEDAQRRITAELKKAARLWRPTEKLQAVFMPGATRILGAEEAERDSDVAAPKLDAADRVTGCVRGLVDREVALRRAQCLNGLVLLRSRLHVKRHFISFRNANITGQIHATKANTLIEQLGERVVASAEKYRQGHGALVRVQGAAVEKQFQPLKDADLVLDGDYAESDAGAARKLAQIGHGARAPRNAPGTSKRIMSWIWTAQGGAVDGEEHLHDSVRVEWCRAYARKLRWCEEVMLVREEMRRVLRYLEWERAEWKGKVATRPDGEVAVRAGVRGYALKQAALYENLAAHFLAAWNKPAVTVARRVIAGVPGEDLEGPDLDSFFTL
ncbi:hypothetical protein C8R46DRAFT_1205581 [Mycena filopes]|nr:hypothetical protein C8R46DRAFT_1205581 [Mycena filopes]